MRHVLISGFIIFMAAGQPAVSDDFSGDIKRADTKVIMEQYAEAAEIYKNIITASDSAIVRAYAHYKLGDLYRKQHNGEKARQEYQKGLASLKKSGQKNHQIGKYLAHAMKTTAN